MGETEAVLRVGSEGSWNSTYSITVMLSLVPGMVLGFTASLHLMLREKDMRAVIPGHE